jgi:hypothetical protein
MKQILFITLFVFITLYGKSQPIVQAEAGYWQFPVIDRVFQAYQLAHPWNESSVQPLGLSAGVAAGWNQNIYALRGLQALGTIHYRYQSTSWSRISMPLIAGYHSASIEMLMRSHPRCLLQDAQNTGPLGTRWYIQLGGGYAWNLPFAKKYGERVTIHNDERYHSISGQFHGIVGTGWHALTIGHYVVTLESTLSWFPQFSLDGMATAVLGHNEPRLAETAQNSLLLQGCLRFTRLKKSSNWWEQPRSSE